jgi:hypothetical protein
MSDRKISSAKRRDERSQKVPDQTTPHRASKNKKKWCKGKVGIPHQPVCRKFVEVKKTEFRSTLSISDTWRILVCSECGKDLDYYYPMKISGYPEQKPPDWVV